tara:strand:+ start:303 stop:650 length:348 start_codon:yes stop_codon:yes gene_type:complete
MSTLHSKYLEEDFRTIEACKKYLLPKQFGDRKYFTAYIRKATRQGIRLDDSVVLEIWMARKNAKEAGFDRIFQNQRANETLVSKNLGKFSRLWQEALLKSEYNNQMPSYSGRVIS